MYSCKVLSIFLTVSSLSRAISVRSTDRFTNPVHKPYGSTNDHSSKERYEPASLTNAQNFPYASMGTAFNYERLSPFHPPSAYFTERKLVNSELAYFLPEFIRFMEQMMIIMANTPRSSTPYNYNKQNFLQSEKPLPLPVHPNSNPSYEFLYGGNPGIAGPNKDEWNVGFNQEQYLPLYPGSTYRSVYKPNPEIPEGTDVLLKSLTHAKHLNKYCVFQGISTLSADECDKYLVCLPARFNRFNAYIAECPYDKKYSTIYRRCVQPYLVPECFKHSIWKSDNDIVNPNSQVEIFPPPQFQKKKYEKPLYRPIKEVSDFTKLNQISDTVVPYEPQLVKTEAYKVGKNASEIGYLSNSSNSTESSPIPTTYELNEELYSNLHNESYKPETIYEQNVSKAEEYRSDYLYPSSTSPYLQEEYQFGTTNDASTQEMYYSSPRSYQVINDDTLNKPNGSTYSYDAELYSPSPSSSQPHYTSTTRYPYTAELNVDQVVDSNFSIYITTSSPMNHSIHFDGYRNSNNYLNESVTNSSSYHYVNSSKNYEDSRGTEEYSRPQNYHEEVTTAPYYKNEDIYSGESSNGTSSLTYSEAEIIYATESSEHNSNPYYYPNEEIYPGKSPNTTTSTEPEPEIMYATESSVHNSNYSYYPNEEIYPGESRNTTTSTEPASEIIYPVGNQVNNSNGSDFPDSKYQGLYTENEPLYQTEIPHPYPSNAPVSEYLRSGDQNVTDDSEIYTSPIVYGDEELEINSNTSYPMVGDLSPYQSESMASTQRPSNVTTTTESVSLSYSQPEPKTSEDQDSVQSRATVPKELNPPPVEDSYEYHTDDLDHDRDHSFDRVGDIIKDTPYSFPPSYTGKSTNPVRRSVREIADIDRYHWRKH